MESNPTVLEIGTRWFPEFPGGLERYFYELVEQLSRAEFNVAALVVASARPYARPSIDVAPFASAEMGLIKRLRSVRRCVRALTKVRHVSLLACHYPLYAAPVLDYIGRIPTVFHFHGPWAAEGRQEGNPGPAWVAKRVIETVLYRQPAHFIVLSGAFRDRLMQSYRVPGDRISVIPGGVDLDRFRLVGRGKKAARQALALDERPTIVAVRRLVRRVGLRHLIAAMQEVSAQIPEAALLIAGRGPLEEELRGQIRLLGLERQVRLLGHVPDADLPTLYQAADVSIIPSLSLEGFGLPMIEALACGTPVLVTPVGGMPEIIGELSRDLVLRGHGPAELAEGLVAFFEGHLHVPDAPSCRSFVADRFGWPIVCREVAKVYRGVLEAR